MTTPDSAPPTPVDWRNLIQAGRDLLRHRQEFSVQARRFADAFADMQQLRHTADYDHNATITINEVSTWLDDTESTILNYLQSALSERIYIATLTLIRPRQEETSEARQVIQRVLNSGDVKI